MMANRPRVFLDVSIGGQPAGRMTIELFADVTPKTCENFRALCTGTEPPLSYKGCVFHRVIDGFMIQGGDTTRGDGTGGASIYGDEFEDENLTWREIDAPGLVCMANRGKGTNNSQFFITLIPCPHLNGRHTIFGRLVTPESTETLHRIAEVPVDDDDKPLKEVIVTRSGELMRRQPQQQQQQRQPQKSSSTVASLSTTRDRPQDNEDSDSSSAVRGRHRHSRTTTKRQRSSSPPQSRSSSSRSLSDSNARSRTHSTRLAKSKKTNHHPRMGEVHEDESDMAVISAPLSPSHHDERYQYDRHRRRSDHVVDETRRGRERRRHHSGGRDADDAGENDVRGEHKRRNVSPSRGSRPRSEDRHADLEEENHTAAGESRGTRESTQRRRDEKQPHGYGGDGHGYRRRRSLPNHYERVRELEQDRGPDRGRTNMDWQRDGAGGRDDRRVEREYVHVSGSGRSGGWGATEGRLGGGGGGHGGGGGANDAAIQYKGRGNMKFREKKQQQSQQGYFGSH